MMFLLAVVCLTLLTRTEGQNTNVNANSACNYFKVQAATSAPSTLKLDLTWYKKYVDATSLGGLWIVGTSVVSDQALLTAARISAYMLRKRPDLQALLVNAGVHVSIMATTELTTQVPEYRYLAGSKLADGRTWDSTRGLGATSYTLTSR